MPLCRLRNTEYSPSTMLRKTVTGPSSPDRHTEGPDKSIVLAAANYTFVDTDDADEKKLPQEFSHPSTEAEIQTGCEGTSPVVTTELSSHEIDANYSAVDVTDQTKFTYASVNKNAKTTKKLPLSVDLEDKPPLAPVPGKSSSTDLTFHDIEANYSAVDTTDQTNFTHASVDKNAKTTTKPSLPARLQCKPPPPVPSVGCQLPDSEILSTYDSIGPNLTSSAVSIHVEVEDATYSVVDVTNVTTSVDKTSEKPPLPKRPEGKLPPPIPGRSPTTELTSQDIDANYSVVDMTNIEDASPLVPVPDKSTSSTELSSHDIDANYSAVGVTDQTSYTYASVEKTTKKPPLPARLQCKPPPPVSDVSCQLGDSEIISTYDSIGPNLTASAVSVEHSSHVEEVEDATYSVVDVTNVSTSVDKKSEKPPLPKRPEGKLPPPIPGRSPTTELTSQDIDANYSVAEETNVTYASVNKKQKSIRRPPLSLSQLPPTPVVDQTLDSTYDTIGPSLSQSTVPAEPLLSHPPVEEQASSTVDGTDQTSYTYASVDMSRKRSGDNPAKKLPPPKPAWKPPPSSYVYSEVNKKTDKHPPDSIQVLK